MHHYHHHHHIGLYSVAWMARVYSRGIARCRAAMFYQVKTRQHLTLSVCRAFNQLTTTVISSLRLLPSPLTYPNSV